MNQPTVTQCGLPVHQRKQSWSSAGLSRSTGMTDMTVANTIREQIGRQALFMLGAKDLTGDAKSLRFRIGRNAKSVSHIQVILDPSDTYTVKAIRCRTIKGVPTVKVVEEMSDVYVDSLHSVIEQFTGMYTSLVPR